MELFENTNRSHRYCHCTCILLVDKTPSHHFSCSQQWHRHMKSRNICNFANIVEIQIGISLTRCNTANSRCPCPGDSPVRYLAPVIRGVFFQLFPAAFWSNHVKILPIATHIWCKTHKVSRPNNFETADFHLTRSSLYFYCFLKIIWVTQGQGARWAVVAVSTFVKQSAIDRIKITSVSEHHVVSWLIFVSMGCFCLLFSREWKLSLNFTFWTLFVLPFWIAWCLLKARGPTHGPTCSRQKLWTHWHGKSIGRSGKLLEKIYAKCIVSFTIINLNKRSYIEMYMYILIICDIILKSLFKKKK
jgi:hypothetical protein